MNRGGVFCKHGLDENYCDDCLWLTMPRAEYEKITKQDEIISTLQSQVEKLREFIKSKGHDSFCKITYQPPEPCDCGLDELLKGQ